jgi:hypothetical protein
VTTPAASLRPGRDKNRGTAIDRQNLCRCHTACDAKQWSSCSDWLPYAGRANHGMARLLPEQKIRATIKVIGGPAISGPKAGVTPRRFPPPWTVEDYTMRASSWKMARVAVYLGPVPADEWCERL